jgi:hypothetical protein
VREIEVTQETAPKWVSIALTLLVVLAIYFLHPSELLRCAQRCGPYSKAERGSNGDCVCVPDYSEVVR